MIKLGDIAIYDLAIYLGYKDRIYFEVIQYDEDNESFDMGFYHTNGLGENYFKAIL